MLDSKIWFSGDRQDQQPLLRRLDPAAGAVTDQGGSLSGGYHVAPVPGSSSQFLWGKQRPAVLARRVDDGRPGADQDPAAGRIDQQPARPRGRRSRHVHLTASGARTTSGVRTRHHAARRSRLQRPTIPAPSPGPWLAGLFICSTGFHQQRLFVYRDGGWPAETFTVAGMVVDHDVALAPDGDHVTLVQLPSSHVGLVATGWSHSLGHGPRPPPGPAAQAEQP